MKKLTIIRHAKSSWSEIGLSDFERPLNERGLRDAPIMGQRLAKSGIQFDLMISSPAIRAITTCGIIADEVGFSKQNIVLKAEIYNASAGALFSLIKQLDDNCHSVAITGHNPGMSIVSNQLCPTVTRDLPTCAIVQLGFDVPHWQDLQLGSATLLDFDYPKKVPGSS